MHPEKTTFVELILPLATGHTFTYSVTDELRPRIHVGVRVTVHFGRGSKIHTALVASLDSKPRDGVRVKPILTVIDEIPVVGEIQLAFWFKMADHYLCSPGEVMLAAMPAQLLLDSETRIIPEPYQDTRSNLPSAEQVALGILDQKNVLSLQEVGELLNLKVPMNKVKQWVEAGHVSLEEQVKDNYIPKTRELVSFTQDFKNEPALNRLFDELNRAPKQTELLMRMIQVSDPLDSTAPPIEKKRLLKISNCTNSILTQLVEKGVFRISTERVTPEGTSESYELPPFTNAQSKAYTSVLESFNHSNVCLLEGVTSSGKTELYLRFIKDMMERGKQILYLLPEIALTTQMIERVTTRMGEGVRVYHSRLTQRERARLWMDLVNHPEKVNLILSARSGVFLPFTNLGGIIVDEEHDPSFKQYDPAPRYHARDMAIVLAAQHGAKTILGSATPSLESLFNAKSGKYGYALLSERYGDIMLPEISTADIKEAKKKHRMHGRFSPELIQEINLRLSKKEQVILFQNRRGYTPIWQCTDCGWVPECDHCDVSLTYHKRDNGLRCHYCGRSYEPMIQCNACSSKKLKMIGFGTEMLEEELHGLFPDAVVARLDQDTARRKNSFSRILNAMTDGTTDILVGTQMVTKGLDLDHVTLVGIMNADALINFPDFRATERAFQLMAQVAGRAGRRKKKGAVIIQTYDPFQHVIELVKEHNTEQLYLAEIEERRQYFYPPFSRLIRLTVKHRNETKANACAHAIQARLEPLFGARVLGPETPYISRIRNMHLRNVLIKLKKGQYRNEKAFAKKQIEDVLALERFRSVRVVIDVDPN